MTAIYIVLFCSILATAACGDENTVYKSTSNYSYEGKSDSLGSTQIVDSKNLEQSEITWEGENLKFSGSDKNISISLKFNIRDKSIRQFAFESFFTDGTVQYDDVSVVEYSGKKNVSHNLHLKFNQFFALNTTTNTTTNSVTFPNDLILVIYEK